MTIFGSSQPLLRKYNCNGATGKILRCKYFLLKSCKRDDPTSKTKTPPITTIASVLPVRRPIIARDAPKDIEPTSPSQILALKILKYKNAATLPISTATKIPKD